MSNHQIPTTTDSVCVQKPIDNRSNQNCSNPHRGSQLSLEQVAVSTKQLRRISLWLLETCWNMDLPRETLFRAIAFVRKYLQSSVLEAKKLQLLASVCLLISYKYGTQLFSLTLRWAVECQKHNQFTEDDALQMEAEVLEALDFNLEVQTILSCTEAHCDSIETDLSLEQKQHLEFWLEAQSVFDSEDPKTSLCDKFEQILRFVEAESQKKRRFENSLMFRLLSRVKGCSDLTLVNKHCSKFDVEEYIQKCQLRLGL